MADPICTIYAADCVKMRWPRYSETCGRWFEGAAFGSVREFCPGTLQGLAPQLPSSPAPLTRSENHPPPPASPTLTNPLVFQIHYWERDKQNQTEKVKVIFVPHTSVHLPNLTSYTPYLVTLTAFNTAGDGPPSDPRGGRTLPSGEECSAILSRCVLNV